MKRLSIHSCLSILLILIAFALLIHSSVTGYAFYRDYAPSYYGGYGFGDFFGLGYIDFQSLYWQYGSFIDAVLFLMIFLGVGKSVFKKHFGDSGTTTYVGIGIFLAFALVLWEQQTQFFLLERFGQYVFYIFLLLLFFYLYKWISHAGGNTLFALAVSYLVYYFFFHKEIQSQMFDKWPGLSQYLGFLDILLGASVIYLVYWLILGRKKQSEPEKSK